MTTRELRIAKWFVGINAFATPALVLPYFGYTWSGAALLGIALAIPAFMGFCVGEQGYFRQISTGHRKFIVYGSAISLVAGPPVILVCVLGKLYWLALAILFFMFSDAMWMVKFSRPGRETPSTSSQVLERS